jgi:hypothetical protein
VAASTIPAGTAKLREGSLKSAIRKAIEVPIKPIAV